MITAVVVDNGEPLLEKSIESLRDQTERVNKIIVVGGDKTDYELARAIADEVYGPITKSIGDARVCGILKAEDEIILSCDSDTIYPPEYAEICVTELREHEFVKASRAEPVDGYSDNPLRNALIMLEQQFYPFVYYEHSLAFRKSAFLSYGLHEFEFQCKYQDIGYPLMLTKLVPVIPIEDLMCYTRLPTRWWTDVLYAQGVPIMMASSIPSTIAFYFIVSR